MKVYLKRHKKTIILLVIFALLLVLTLKIKDILIPNEALFNYGSRLNEKMIIQLMRIFIKK